MRSSERTSASSLAIPRIANAIRIIEITGIIDAQPSVKTLCTSWYGSKAAIPTLIRQQNTAMQAIAPTCNTIFDIQRRNCNIRFLYKKMMIADKRVGNANITIRQIYNQVA